MYSCARPLRSFHRAYWLFLDLTYKLKGNCDVSAVALSRRKDLFIIVMLALLTVRSRAGLAFSLCHVVDSIACVIQL